MPRMIPKPNRPCRPSAIAPALVVALLGVAVLAGICGADRIPDPVQGEIVQEHLVNGQGTTVLHVWGTHHEMGYAHGVLLADWIQLAFTEIRSTFGAYWPQVRARVAGWTWLPAVANDEFQGILDGVKAVHPESTMDMIDLKACATFGDWAYSAACRSTAVWGEWVEPPLTTIAARKLQFMTLPGQVTQQWHHVVCAWEPTDGSPAWINFGFPGDASSVTGLNEYGTLASLHDWNSNVGTNWADALPRTMACRWILTMDGLGADPMTHLQTAFDALQPYHAATGGFVNYYVPGGGAGVIRSSRNAGFYAVRLPRQEYMDGGSISTNNSDIDGTVGIEPWDAYYRTLAPPVARATMDGIWSAAFQSTDMHIVEVGFRGPRDMTIRFQGRIQSGMDDRIEFEWGDVFRNPGDAPAVEPREALVPAPFPNPATAGDVTIVLDAAAAGAGIYDAAGRLVRMLRPVDAGHATFRWDGRDAGGRAVPAGTYFCRPLTPDGRGAGAQRMVRIGR